MEREEIVKLLVVIVVLAIAISGVVMLLQGKGGTLIDSIKDFMRFGK